MNSNSVECTFSDKSLYLCFMNMVKLDYGFRADIVVEERVVVELKCKEAIHPVDEAQLLSPLRRPLRFKM